jgi:hypothetical protein
MKISGIRILAAAALAVGLSLAVTAQTPGTGATATAEAPTTGASARPDHVTLTWTGDPATTMTVTWRTDAAVGESFVEYGQGATLTGKALRAPGTARAFTSDLGTARVFSATLTGLAPGRRYAYRVGGGERWSDTSSFETARKKVDRFKFLLFGDSQAPITGDAPFGLWRRTALRAIGENPDARFMVINGDLTDWGLMQAHWNAWFAASRGIIDRLPFMPVSGNHEHYGSRKVSRQDYYLAQFTLPGNGPEGLRGQAYSYDYGPVHFVVLDSQQVEQRQQGDILTPQKEWLERDLAGSKAPWKIVFFHRPPYGTKLNRDEAEIRDAFCPILERHGVDLVFSAHDHGIARTPPMKGGVATKKASEGTIYLVVGQSGGKTYKDNVKKEFHSFFYNPLDQPNYWVLEVSKKKLAVKVLKLDGTTIDSFEIDRKGNFKQKEQLQEKKAA